jgi:hypothetical protein|nr:MAG TPA: dTDP Sugar Isomerase.1, dTDP Sugar Isomerase, Structural [Caudoviricetes sp.]
MLFIKNSDLQWFKDEEHDMYAGVHDSLPVNADADIMFAKIEPGHTLPIHWHTRPLCQDGTDTGYESFFFFEGGKFLLLRGKENIEYDVKEPFTLTFFSGEDDMHGIKNIGERELVFQVLCAPRFSDDEEHFV